MVLVFLILSSACSAPQQAAVKPLPPAPPAPSYGNGLAVEIYFSSEETDPERLGALVRKALERLPAALVSMHDYAITSNYPRMRELEKMAGMQKFSPAEGFIFAGDNPPFAIAGEDNLLSELIPTLEHLAAAIRKTHRQTLLAIARQSFPRADAVVPVSDDYLYRIKTRQTAAGYLADVFVPPECPGCAPGCFVVLFTTDAVTEAVVPVIPMMMDGRRVDASQFLPGLRGIGDAAELIPGTPDGIPLMPQAPALCRMYVNGTRTALADLKALLEEPAR